MKIILMLRIAAILGNIGVLVLPNQKGIAKAHEAFDENGQLKDEQQQQEIHQLGNKLATVVAKLSS
jgi:hypothetical protein